MHIPELGGDDRIFLERISRAVVANPFSDERAAIDREISGASAGVPPGQALEMALRKLRTFLDELEARGGGRTDQFRAADRELIRTAFLFDVFHRFTGSFDALIRKQTESAEPCRAPFAAEALALLAQRGFAPQEAARYFAIFYQLRRAFYFINDALVGRSECMKELRLALWNNVFTRDLRLYERHLWNRMEDFSTLLLGETGTGKGAAAAAIGQSGFIPFDEKKLCFEQNFMGTFIPLNLSQFPETLIESELFGHRKGAFTGAVESHEGVFARCSPHGAIFLDEIGDVGIPVQIKLLKVLQEREFSPVGSHEKRRFRGRVIAASNRSVGELRSRGQFRDDFFYRLCSDVITVPPLRQRLAEDPAELDDLLTVMIQRIIGHADDALQSDVHKAISTNLGPGYAWPGNVRELEQGVRRILLTRRYDGDARNEPASTDGRLARQMQEGALNARQLLASYCALLHERLGTYEAVSRRTGLDRRTVKKHVDAFLALESQKGVAR